MGVQVPLSAPFIFNTIEAILTGAQLPDQLLGKKARGETGDSAAAKVTCSELLDDLLEYAEGNIKASTAHIWKLVIEANIKPFFGHLKTARLTTSANSNAPAAPSPPHHPTSTLFGSLSPVGLGGENFYIPRSSPAYIYFQ